MEEKLRESENISAFIALGALNFMLITSLTTLRQRCYKLFIFSHIVGFSIFMITVSEKKNGSF